MCIAAAMSVVGLLVVPVTPSMAATGTIHPAGQLKVIDFGPHAGDAHSLNRSVSHNPTRDLVAHRDAKLRAAARLGPASGITTLAPLAGVFNNLNQPGLNASNESFCCTPPDPTGAIGPNHYVEMVNSLIGVYDRSNLSLISSMDTASFVAAPSGLTLSDPQIEFDFVSNRWFYLAVAFATGNNFLVFGWSKTSDPSDLSNGWCRFGVGTGSSLNDFPKLGHDDNYLLFGSNIYDDSNLNTEITGQIWAYRKPGNGDASCTGTGVATFFADAAHLLHNADGTLADTPVPVNTTESSTGGYIIAAHSPLIAPAGPRNKVMVWHMTMQSGSPVLVADGDITVNSYDVPADVPQPQNLLDTLDGQLTQAVGRHDPDTGALAIWTQHTVAGPGGRSVMRWYELLPASLGVRQEGDVSSSSNFIFNGAISTSTNGNDAVVEYNSASASQTPLIAAQSRTGSTPLGTMDVGEVVLASSVDVDVDFSCSAPYGPPCRWGDYSGVTPDPVNAGVIWGSNMVNGQGILGFPQWTTQSFSLTTGGVVTPDFNLAVTPSSQTIAAGDSTTYSVTITPTGGFAGAVSLAVGGLPSGATGSFSPNPATTSSTLTVTSDASTAAGTYPLAVTGTSGSLSHTASTTLVVNAPPTPDFNLSVNPASQTVSAGASTSYAVTITPSGGFAGSVTLGVTGLPASATGTFSPNPATTTSNLSVVTDPATPAGSYALTISGTSGSLSHTAPATLVVNAVLPPDFTISAAPTSRTVGQGVNATSYSVTIGAVNGFNASVALAVDGLPVGASGTFSPNPATTASTLNVNITSITPSGSYVLTITGTSGGLSHSTTVTLLVADFSLSVSPSTVSLAAGGRATYTVTINPMNGFSGSVTLSVSGLPPKTSASFSPDPATGSSTLTIRTNRGQTPPGSYAVVISGTSSGVTHTVTVTLVVS